MSEDLADTAEDFDFVAGDYVVVRIRRDLGTNGPLRAKFVAECEGFDGPRGPRSFGTVRTVLSPVWADSRTGRITFNQYDAEFERVDSPDEVTF